jgi:excisionase family DNA binding protein
MHDTTTAQSSELHALLDHAEAILTKSMPAPIARAIIDLARAGAASPTSDVATARMPELDDDRDELLTTHEAAARLRVSHKQIYRLVEQGRLQRYGYGRHHRFRSSDITAVIAQQQGKETTRAAVRAARMLHDGGHAA